MKLKLTTWLNPNTNSYYYTTITGQRKGETYIVTERSSWKIISIIKAFVEILDAMYLSHF